jgi:hypothetical protein
MVPALVVVVTLWSLLLYINGVRHGQTVLGLSVLFWDLDRRGKNWKMVALEVISASARTREQPRTRTRDERLVMNWLGQTGLHSAHRPYTVGRRPRE